MWANATRTHHLIGLSICLSALMLSTASPAEAAATSPAVQAAALSPKEQKALRKSVEKNLDAGDEAWKAKHHDEADRSYSAALPDLERAGIDPNRVSLVLAKLSALRIEQKRLGEAETLMRSRIAILEKEPHAALRRMLSLQDLAWLLRELRNRPGEAEAITEQQVDLCGELTRISTIAASESPGTALQRENVDAFRSEVSEGCANGLVSLAWVRDNRGDSKQAEQLMLRAQETASEPGARFAVMVQRGSLLLGNDKAAEAEAVLLDALAVLNRAPGGDLADEIRSDILRGLGNAVAAQRRYDEAVAFLDEALAQARKHSDVRPDRLARCLEALAQTMDRKGDRPRAEELYRELLALREMREREEPAVLASAYARMAFFLAELRRLDEADAMAQRAGTLAEQGRTGLNVLYDLAYYWGYRGRIEEAEAWWHGTSPRREDTWGAEHPSLTWPLLREASLHRACDRLAEAEADVLHAGSIARKERPDDDPFLSQVLEAEGDLWYDLVRWDDAEAAYRKRIEILERDPRADPDVMASALLDLASLLSRRDRRSEAEPVIVRARELAGRPDRPGAPCDSCAAAVLRGIGWLLMRDGRSAEAGAEATRALALYDASSAPDDNGIVSTLELSAAAEQEEGRLAEADARISRLLVLQEAHDGPSHPHTASALLYAADLRFAQANIEESRRLASRAVEIFDAAYGADALRTVPALGSLATAQRVAGEYGGARATAARALAITGRNLPPEHPRVADAQISLAWAELYAGRPAEAERLARSAVCIAESSNGIEHPSVAEPLTVLTRALAEQGRFAEAAPLAQRALVILEGHLKSDDPSLAGAVVSLARVRLGEKRWAEAEPLIARARRLREAYFDSSHVYIAEVLLDEARLKEGQGRRSEAEPPLRRALAIYDKPGKSPHPGVVVALDRLADVLAKTGRKAEAATLVSRAEAIRASLATGGEK